MWVLPTLVLRPGLGVIDAEDKTNSVVLFPPIIHPYLNGKLLP